MTTPTQELIERLRNGTAHLSLRQIEELWADAAGALEAAMKTQQLGQTKPAQDDNLYRLSLLVESDVLPDGLEVRRVVKAALQEFAALRRAASRITELQDEVAKITRWANTSLDSVKAEMWKYEEALLKVEGHLSDYIETHKTVDVSIAVAYETSRAALGQQGDRG